MSNGIIRSKINHMSFRKSCLQELCKIRCRHPFRFYGLVVLGIEVDYRTPHGFKTLIIYRVKAPTHLLKRHQMHLDSEGNKCMMDNKTTQCLNSLGLYYLAELAILAKAPSKLSAKLTTLLNNTEASDSKGSPNNSASLRTFWCVRNARLPISAFWC